MQDELRRAIEKTDKSVDKIEKLIRALAGDIGDVKREVRDLGKRVGATEKLLELLAESRKDADSALREMAASQSSMASAAGQALAQLSLAQSLEKRVERLEAMVFPPKH